MRYFIDNMLDSDRKRYMERSIRALNGIRKLSNEIQKLLTCHTITGKYYLIAQYIGLTSDNDNSYYNYFIPTNNKLLFLLRFSNHNNTNPTLYSKHEQNGHPNKRYVIYFDKDAVLSDNPETFLDAEHHVIPYPVNALDTEEDVLTFLKSLEELFTNGETTFYPLPKPQQSQLTYSHD